MKQKLIVLHTVHDTFIRLKHSGFCILQDNMSNTSDKLVASLLSAATTVKIHTREDLAGKTLGKGGPTPVDLVHLHSILLKKGPVTDTRCVVFFFCCFIKGVYDLKAK